MCVQMEAPCPKPELNVKAALVGGHVALHLHRSGPDTRYLRRQLELSAN